MPLRIGIIADDSLQQLSLRKVIEAGRCQVGSSLLSSQLQSADQLLDLSDSVDAWLVDVDMDVEQAQCLDAWLDEEQQPVIFGDGVPDPGSENYSAWLRRLTNKVRQLAGVIALQQGSAKRANRVWVLGASTGGPAAVKAFLQQLPPELGVAFIYVQHIDSDFDQTLLQMFGSQSHYRIEKASHGSVIQENSLTLIAPDHYVEVLENGTLSVSDRPWSGDYSPSVDQLVANVGRVYGPRSGVIIFSGMGDDGAKAARLMKQCGGEIWAQQPTSCTSSSMPDSVIATSTVSRIDTPEGLATQLRFYIKCQQSALC